MIQIDWKSIKQKLTKDKRDLPPMGMRIYEAPQGGGKTLSMVHDAWGLKKKYPKLVVISNMPLKFADKIVIGAKGVVEALKIDNGENGVLMIIDEFQLFASKKQGVSYEVFQGLCQQRKHRRFLMGTAQDWEDIDVSSRKKVAEVVKCNKLFNLQVNRLFDGYSIKWSKESNGWECKPKGWMIFKHNDNLYKAYDTYAEVSLNQEMIQSTKIDFTTAAQLSGGAGAVEKSK